MIVHERFPLLFPLLLLFVLPVPGLIAETPDLQVKVLHDPGKNGAKRISRDGDRVTLTATGRESYLGRDDGSFAYINTEALNWTFTARLAEKPTGTKNPKYGIAVRTGLDARNRSLHVRYDGYEGNEAIQWLYRFGVGKSTHHGLYEKLHSGVEKKMTEESGFWIRIDRTYPEFRLFWSADGADWNEVGAGYSFHFLPRRMYVGLMLTGGGNGKTPVTATYDHVSFEKKKAPGDRPKPETFTSYDMPRKQWEMWLVQADHPNREPDSQNFFVMKPTDLKWKDVRALMYQTGSKEIAVYRDGKLKQLKYDGGKSKRRKPAGMNKWEGHWTDMPPVAPHYRFFSAHDVAVLGGAGRYRAFPNALEELAEVTGYSGLKNLPFVNSGMSFAGGWTAQVANLWPEQNVAAAPTHIGVAGWDTKNKNALNTPRMYVIGSEDGTHLKSVRRVDQPLRERGALWAHTPLWWYYHTIGHTISVVLPYFLRCIDLRVPENADPSEGPIKLNVLKEEEGWLGLHETWDRTRSGPSSVPKILPWEKASKKQRRGDASWFPDRYTARVWQAATSANPGTVIRFPRFDSTDGWSGPPPDGQVHHYMAANEPFTILSSGPVGEEVEVTFYDGLNPLEVKKRWPDQPHIVRVEGLDPGMHVIYAITKIGNRKEISRPQMLLFVSRDR